MFLYLKLKNLRNSEFVQYNQDLLKIIENNNPEELKINDQYTELNQLQLTLTEVYKQNTGSSITKELEELDYKRDNAITGISILIDAYTNHYDDKIKLAAEKLNKSLENYGSGIARLNYQAETSTINDILGKWETDADLKAAAELLHLTDWLNLLKADNTLFNERYLARIQESANESDIKVIDVRNTMVTKHSKLLNHIRAYAIINGEEAYSAVINQINALMEQYKKLLSSRKTTSTTEENTVE